MVLKPEAIKTSLRDCGYRPGLLRTDVIFGDAPPVPLVGFSQYPTDVRSACVAVLADSPDPREAVEASRPLGAPLVFACHRDTLQWWKQGTTAAEFLEAIPARKVPDFFRSHREEFEPGTIYRAKTLGRIRSEYQLSFVDLGVMPLVEKEVGTALSQLLTRNLTELRTRLGWEEITTAQGQWLLQSVFWLVSAKILRDKSVPSFDDLQLEDIDDAFSRVASHYGSNPLPVSSKRKREALREAARTIGRFSNLALTTTESLGFVYENTLISKRTRSQLGTHSTPSYLVDYVLGHLDEWIREIPESARSVFEPACGHAAFLVSAMRVLTQLLPEEKSIPSRRGPYLRSRLHGTDIDAFALELARLSLTLTDIPNPDGWDLRAEDMFVGDRLDRQVRGNTILLANPPFGAFEQDELTRYAKAGAEVEINNKAAEMLRRTLPALEPGGVFGVVVPQNILHGAFAESLRRSLIEKFELGEITLFPDKVFPFSDAECAVLIGRRLPERTLPKAPVRFSRVRERQMPAFCQCYEAPGTREVEQSRFNETVRWDLRIPELEDVWRALSGYPVADELAEFGTGLVYEGKNLPAGSNTYSEHRFPGAKQGFIKFERHLPLHGLPKLYWMNLDDAVVMRRRAGTTVGVPQVLLNYARVSRGPWRLKALIDRVGRPVASRFLTVRPRQGSLEVLWALLNSPVANAFAFCHLGKRDNIASDMRRIPMPRSFDLADVELAAQDYLEAATGAAEPEELRALMARLDAAVLRQYALPVEIEQSLLSLFTGWKRVGVPFEQARFLPDEVEAPLSYSEFVDYEADWTKTNARRGRLIDKRIKRTISKAERAELCKLQAYADYHLDQVAPRSSNALDELEEILISARGSSK